VSRATAAGLTVGEGNSSHIGGRAYRCESRRGTVEENVAMAAAGDGFEVPCIKCGLVDPAEGMMRLAFVINDSDNPGELTIEQRGFPVWLHRKCWLDYCATAAALATLDLRAMTEKILKR
jgi:hypothetical protein